MFVHESFNVVLATDAVRLSSAQAHVPPLPLPAASWVKLVPVVAGVPGPAWSSLKVASTRPAFAPVLIEAPVPELVPDPVTSSGVDVSLPLHSSKIPVLKVVDPESTIGVVQPLGTNTCQMPAPSPEESVCPLEREKFFGVPDESWQSAAAGATWL